MRRSRQPLIGLVLFGSGVLSALPVAVICARIAEALGAVPPPRWTAPFLVAMVVAADMVHRTTGRLRPVAVNRQVPQHWGHELGPWWASLRYGPRLAIGPATILTSWAWWAMVICGALAGWRWSCASALVFVAVRSALTVLVGAGVRDGTDMARRFAGVHRMAPQVASACAVVLAVAGAGALVV